MTIPRWSIAIVVVVLLAVGAVVGRFTVNQKVVYSEKIVTVDRDTTLSFTAYVGHTEKYEKTSIKWVTKTISRPDGTTETETRAEQGSETSTKQDVSSQQTTIREVVKYQDREVLKTVESPTKDWHFALQLGSKFSEVKVQYGASVYRRILGPFMVGAWASGGGANTNDLSGGVGLAAQY